MAGASARSQRCEGARQAVSLKLDGELSQLQSVLLAVHVRRCVDCREFEAELASLTATLRAAPLEPLERPIMLPRRRSRVSRASLLTSAAAAAAVLAAIGLTGAVDSIRPGVGPPRLQPQPVPAKVIETDDVLVRSVQWSTSDPPQIGVPLPIEGSQAI
jgi:hypothetical protein